VFHKVALRPGKPLWFGIKNGDEHRTLVFGLPGNPVSSFVCFELFVRPVIAALAGRGFSQPNLITAQLSHEFDHPGGRATYLPACLKYGNEDLRGSAASPPDPRTHFVAGESTPSVKVLPWHGSGDLAALAHANGLACLPAEKCRLSVGAPIKVMVI
jgi:molybdopterin molybdotransferase